MKPAQLNPMTGDVWIPEGERSYDGGVWDYVDEVDEFEFNYDQP